MRTNAIHMNLSTIIRWPLRLGFFKKITVHVIFMTLLTGVGFMGATAYQFRREVFRLEYDSAFIVYSALTTYLYNHYQRHQTYVPRILDYHLRTQFLRVSDEAGHAIRHRPAHVVIYDDVGRILYEYMDDDRVAAAEPQTPGRLPITPTLRYDRSTPFIQISGPIELGSPDSGFVMIEIPTTIQHQLHRLFLQSILILIGVLTITILMSLVFTRQTLSPIRSLTQAARAVHDGDLSQHVEVITQDEIGDLITTFNEMVSSMDRRLDVMHRMQDWSVRIGRQMHSKRLFEALGEMFGRMSMAESYRLYLHDNDRDRLSIRLEVGAEDLPDLEQDTLTHLALKERWTMYKKADGSFDNEPTDVCELAIPLLSGKHRIGVIRIGRRNDRALYDDDTLTILQTLAQHASVAIDNAGMYEKLAAQERMAQEMTLARQIQQEMLPRQAPEIPGYEIVGGSAPALEVGGDYYDYVQSKNDTFVLIGDVSGKGVPAALIMSIARALIHAYIEFESSTSEMLRRVNRSISRDLDEEMFVTMTALKLEPDSHRLRFSRAGHEPLLIVHADGTCERITPPGTALGMLEVETFEDLLEESVYEMQPGDTVILYTDGITEAQNTAREEFGYERLEQAIQSRAQLPVRDLFEQLIDDLHLFTSGVAQLDDITLVILRRT